ncbi:hypothetical protein [Allostreptomyces psammosilenae]|uniref:Uncharacterized protein n=1 Tax=Allostreptomyces psammosilenae TaxID=1892865 RepID=A0A852ZZS1_9ACTN|nr:hypothetical protein [Allostreptomyces psammosilenae]NYI03628.1 hypothetical protein [Allostreptomyces psammosilenae]
MAGLFDRAREQAQRGLEMGRQKVEEVQVNRAGHDLARKLGAAYYALRHNTGSQAQVDDALRALERHIQEHGDGALRS